MKPVRRQNKNETTKHFEASKIVLKSRSNLVGPFLFLPKEKREALESVYAFCRLVDDAVDEAYSVEEAKKNLSFFETKFKGSIRAKNNADKDPLFRAIDRFKIPIKPFYEILKGMRQDLRQKRYKNFETLIVYMDRVASAVGKICMAIFECHGDEADAIALAMGRALQLTNILRDIQTDAKKGRIYLPKSDLLKFGVSEKTILNGIFSKKLETLLREQILRAERFYNDAFLRLKQFPKSKVLIAWMMGRIYFDILQTIKKNPSIVFKKRVSVPLWKKIFLIGTEIFLR